MNRREMLASAVLAGVPVKKEEEKKKDKFYVYNVASGGLKLRSLKKYWCVFVYKANEDTSIIEGQYPLTYKSQAERGEFLNSKAGKMDLEEWEKEGYKVVLREVEMLDSWS